MGIKLIKISVIYLFIGTCMGMYMSITGDYTLSSVHSHISLLGWTTMTLSGIVYHIFPEASESLLCKIQFWLFNVGLPLMIIGMGIYLYDVTGSIIVVSIGGILTSIAILLFMVNVLTGVKRTGIDS
ncbi:cytochrome-c oxidase [Thermodesulfobacteriota bacterium]